MDNDRLKCRERVGCTVVVSKQQKDMWPVLEHDQIHLLDSSYVRIPVSCEHIRKEAPCQAVILGQH
jgi:Fe-S-cluster-containing hydrogenase component 2